MSYMDKYIARDNAYGNNVGDSLRKSTINKINDSFKDDPFYRQVLVNTILTDVRMVQETEFNKRTLLFKPSTKIDLGSYVDIDTEKWIALDFFNNDIYPKCTIYQCNETFKWKDKTGAIHQYGCYINKGRGALGSSPGGTFDIELPNGYMYLDIQLNTDTMTLLPSLRFMINGRPFLIDGIDNGSQTLNGKGVLKLTIKQDTFINGDDAAGGFADNSMLYGASSAGKTTPPTGGNPW